MKAIGRTLIAVLLILTCALQAQSPGTKLWEFQTQTQIDSSPSVGPDGTIYISSYDFWKGTYQLIAVTPAGSKKWEFRVGNSIKSAPAIGTNGTIYVTCSDGTLYALNPEGDKLWEFHEAVVPPYPPVVTGSPALAADGSIYFGAYSMTNVREWAGISKLYCINPDGTKRWEHATTGLIEASPVVGIDGAVYFGVTGSFFALNPDGTLYWKIPALTVYAPPAIGSDGTLYLAIGSTLKAIHPDGTVLWGSPINNGNSTPTIGSDGTIYYGWGEFIYAFYPDGSPKWKIDCWAGVAMPTVGADGTLYCWAALKLCAFYPSGAKRWESVSRKSWPQSPSTFSAVLTPDGILYASDFESGTLYAVKADSGLASSPWPMVGRDMARSGRASPSAPMRPYLAPLRLARGRGFQFTMIGESGAGYRIESSTNLSHWTVLTNFASPTALTHWLDSSATNLDRCFYRAILK